MRTLPALCLGATLVACGGGKDSAGTQVSTEPAKFDVRMTNISAAGAQATTGGGAVDAMFAPGALILHEPGWKLFEPGQALLFPEMEAIAEDGKNAPLLAALEAVAEVYQAKSYANLDEDYSSIPMLPGDDALLTVTAQPGWRLTVLTMYGESNDVFVATPSQGIELFDELGQPIFRDVSDQLGFYDAGTEVNEPPGAGDNQPARQADANTGDDENGIVTAIDGTDPAGYSYPAADAWLSVTLTEVVE